MNRADCRTIRSAALTLADWAESLRAGHTNPTTGEWGNELTALKWHDKHLRLVKALRKLANAEQKLLGKGSSRG